jgi:hypothetical protein
MFSEQGAAAACAARLSALHMVHDWVVTDGQGRKCIASMFHVALFGDMRAKVKADNPHIDN